MGEGLRMAYPFRSEVANLMTTVHDVQAAEKSDLLAAMASQSKLTS